MSLPPDRGHILTEHRHQRSMGLDALSTRECVELIIEDHRGVADSVAAAAEALTALIDELVGRMRAGGRLIYVGAGTSGRLGVLDASECPPTFHNDPTQVVGVIAGGDAALRRSSEAREDDRRGATETLSDLDLTNRDTLVGIAAGGTTPYVLGAIELAKAAGAATALLTCVAPQHPPAGCDHLIVVATGAELLTGSTRLKAGSATKLALNIITTATFVRLGKVYSNLMVDLRTTNAKLTDRAIRVLIELCPELSREAAVELLRQSEGFLKAAIIMGRLNLNTEQANALLTDHKGQLGPILDR